MQLVRKGGGGRGGWICRKKERNFELEIEPLKFKWGLAKGGGGRAGRPMQGMGTPT
jgi:hypothetical protein